MRSGYRHLLRCGGARTTRAAAARHQATRPAGTAAAAAAASTTAASTTAIDGCGRRGGPGDGRSGSGSGSRSGSRSTARGLEEQLRIHAHVLDVPLELAAVGSGASDGAVGEGGGQDVRTMPGGTHELLVHRDR